MTEEHIAAIVAAYNAGDATGLAAAGRRAGIAVTYADLVALRAMGDDQPIPMREIVATLLEAIHLDHGVSLRTFDWAEGPFRRVFCLAVRAGNHVTVGINGSTRTRSTASSAWPSLRPWYNQLSRNVERAAAWAQVEPVPLDCLRIAIAYEPEVPAGCEADLIREIVADPDDEAPRLVLADLLMERGDPRGELIRSNNLALQLQYGRILAGEIAEHAMKYYFARGFVEEVVMSAPAFVQHGERLFSSQPIRRLRVVPCDASIVGSLRHGPTHVIRELDVTGSYDDDNDAVLAALAGARLDRLEKLEIRNGRVDAEAVARLRAPRLVLLELEDARMTVGALQALGALGDSLASLKLSSIEPDDETPDETGADEAPRLPNLRELVFFECWFATDRRVAQLVRPPLATLDLWQPGPQTLEAIARCDTLETLRLYFDTPPSPTVISGILALPRLCELGIYAGDDRTIAPLAKRVLALPRSHPLKRVGTNGRYDEALARRFAPLFEW